MSEGELELDCGASRLIEEEIPYGTTAWSRSYGRRAIAEKTNSVLRTGLAQMVRGYTKVMGLTKQGLVLALAMCAINLKITEALHERESVEIVEHSPEVLIDLDEGIEGPLLREWPAPEDDRGPPGEAADPAAPPAN